LPELTGRFMLERQPDMRVPIGVLSEERPVGIVERNNEGVTG